MERNYQAWGCASENTAFSGTKMCVGKTKIKTHKMVSTVPCSFRCLKKNIAESKNYLALDV